MQSYHNALAANNTGLPEFSSMPLFDWIEPANSNHVGAPFPPGLTMGGRVVFARTRRPVSTCNLLAAIAGYREESANA